MEAIDRICLESLKAAESESEKGLSGYYVENWYTRKNWLATDCFIDGQIIRETEKALNVRVPVRMAERIQYVKDLWIPKAACHRVKRAALPVFFREICESVKNRIDVRKFSEWHVKAMLKL